MKLTPEMKAQELGYLRRLSEWPWYPYLPMKRYREPGQMPTHGIVTAVAGMALPVVYEVGIFDTEKMNVFREAILGGLEGLKKAGITFYPYTTLEELIDDEWLVD